MLCFLSDPGHAEDLHCLQGAPVLEGIVRHQMLLISSVTSVTLDVDWGLCANVEHGESRLVIDSTETGINEKMCGTRVMIICIV
jgi:hypothetical protein